MEAGQTDGQAPVSPVKRERYAYEHAETGRFIFAEENTWAANAQRVKNTEFGIGFNTKEYDYFDAIIAKKLGLRPLTDKKHADYKSYQALRDNIAVLRNYILTQYEESGLFEGNMQRQMDRLASIAESLGQALANDKGFSRALSKFTSVDVANIDGVGACEMYKHLLELQERPTGPEAVISLMRDLKAFLNIPDHDWRLPDLELSPFSPANLAAPPPGYVPEEKPKPESNTDTDTDMRQQSQGESQQKQDDIMQSVAQCEQIVQQANQLYSLETLADEPRGESIEEARKILRLLRNMEFTDRSMEQFLDSTPAAATSKKQAFSRLADIFAQHMRHATHKDPSLRHNPAVEQARDTVATIALELTEHTRRQLLAEEQRIAERLEQQHQIEERLNGLIDSLPLEADFRIPQSVDRLLDTLELGLQHCTGQEVELSNIDRLSQSSLRTHAWALQLYEEKVEVHTREESLEHAREILQQLQKLVPPGQTLEEFAEQSTLAEKVSFAKQVEELVETYRNIMSEAYQSNPSLMFDEEVRAANDAVGGFASAVKLMASKEIPNSIAAAQQISADITQEPSEWKNLHHRAVDRLIKSAEGGLDKAISEIAQDDEEEQAEDVAQELLESSLLDADKRKRKKRRRGGEAKSKSGKGGKKQRRKQMDLSADDRYLKQGVYADFGEDVEKREAKDVAKAQARKKDKNQQKTTQELQADEYLLGQGRFSEDRNPQNTDRESTRRPSNTNNERNPNSRQNRNNPNRNSQRSNDPNRAGSQSASDPNRSSQGNSARTGQVAAPSSSRSSGGTPAITLNARDMAAIQQLGGSLRELGNQVKSITADTVVPDNMKQQNNPDRDQPGKRGKDTSGPKI